MSDQYIDLAKPKSRACIFFPCTPQGHNTLPQPGLEPRSSDLEPSALTTGLLNKGVTLACPQYSWPHMLKVAPCTVVQLYGCTSKFFQLDGLLLLFCIIMGLCSASSAISSSLLCNHIFLKNEFLFIYYYFFDITGFHQSIWTSRVYYEACIRGWHSEIWARFQGFWGTSLLIFKNYHHFFIFIVTWIWLVLKQPLFVTWCNWHCTKVSLAFLLFTVANLRFQPGC